jgi:hypothetical protein
VNVSRCGSSGAADATDAIAALDVIANRDMNRREVPIEGGHAAPMINHDQSTVVPAIACMDNNTGGCGTHGCSIPGADVLSRVKLIS